MKRLILLFFAFFLMCQSGTASDDVVLLGHFSNQKVTQDADPHFISGYSVSLYQSDQIFFGDIGVAVGSSEPVSGQLYDIEFDPGTKKLSFKVKYSDGREFPKEMGREGRDSRVLLTFAGKLSRKALAGTVVLQDGYSLEKPGTRTYEIMKREKDDYKPHSMAEWSKYRSSEVDW